MVQSTKVNGVTGHPTVPGWRVKKPPDFATPAQEAGGCEFPRPLPRAAETRGAGARHLHAVLVRRRLEARGAGAVLGAAGDSGLLGDVFKRGEDTVD